MANDELQTYINDHLGGSAAAVEMLEHLIGAAGDDADERRFFETLRAEIEADRKTLEQLLERVGGHRSAIRQVGGWLGEKLVSLKMRWDDPGGRRLNYLQALETLALGVLGKRALWRVLGSTAGALPVLRGVDFAQLEARAQDQHDRLDARRIAAGRRLFAERQEAPS